MSDKMTIGSIVQLTESGVEQRIDFMGETIRRFADVSQQQMEAGLRQKLTELGWTPPGVMDAVLNAARDVVRWDWSTNDEDCVADIERLRKAVSAV
jgi:hypothetical protein